MGFFNLNTILYTIRKVSKYILFSLLIIAFIIFCLLFYFLDTSVYATDILTGTYNQSRGYGSESSFGDRFDLDFTINSNGSVTISGTMGTDSNPTLATFSGHTFSINFNDPNYEYVFICRHHEQNGRYLMYRVPRGSTYYVYNANTWSNWEAFNSAFYCNQSYSYYDQNGYIRDYSAGHVDITNDFSSYAFGNCNTYTDSSLTTVLYNPFESSYNPPYIALPNDSTTNFINGEFSQFMVVSYDDIDSLYFHLVANPDVLPNTNSLELILDENSPYYLSNYTPEGGGKVFLIPKFDLPLGYVDDTDYDMWLGYEYNDNLYTTEIISWTTSFSSTAIENDRIRVQSGMANSLSNVQDFISSDKINENDINLPTVQFDFNQDHFVSDLFTALRNSFTGEQYNDFVFNIPFTNESITISSNYIEQHCPTVILNLIRLFYWYVIGRFMLKDVFRSVDKMRQGDWFLRSEGNIKTEVL